METLHFLDGRRIESGPLTLAVVNYGHFTAMQVRTGRVRGLGTHLSRVDTAHHELFGHRLDLDRVRRQWAKAVEGHPDSSLKVTFYDDSAGETHCMIVVRPPVEAASAPQRLRSASYVRPFAHIKHVGTFAQIHLGELAERDGYDDVLLVDGERCVAETTIANVGFVRGGRIVWPKGAMLDGVGQQLLRDALGRAGIQAERCRVSLDMLDQFDAAFAVNSVGVVAIAEIDQHRFRAPDDHVAPIVEIHDRLTWDALAP